MKWFKHMAGARNDYKIAALEGHFGVAGYGYYFKLIEFLAEQWTGYGEPVFRLRLVTIRGLFRSQNAPTIKILKTMDSVGLIHLKEIVEGAFHDVTISCPALKDIKDNATSKKTDRNGLTLDQKDYLVERDLGKCSYCLDTLSGESINFDHFVPISCGGSSELDNYVVACKKCNSFKGSTHPDELYAKHPSYWRTIPTLRTKLALEKNRIDKTRIEKNREEESKTSKKARSAKPPAPPAEIVFLDETLVTPLCKKFFGGLPKATYESWEAKFGKKIIHEEAAKAFEWAMNNNKKHKNLKSFLANWLNRNELDLKTRYGFEKEREQVILEMENL